MVILLIAVLIIALTLLFFIYKNNENKRYQEIDARNVSFDWVKALIRAEGKLPEKTRDRLKEEGAKGVPPVMEVWESLTPDVRNEITDIWETQGLIDEYINALASNKEGERIAAAGVLIKLKDKRVLPRLVKALEQPDKYLPARVAEVLTALEEDTAEHLSAVLSEMPEKTKSLCIDILQEIRDERTSEALIRELANGSAEIRKKAAAALGEVGSTRAVDSLILLMKDTDGGVRSWAAKALGQIGIPSAIPVLKQAESDEDWCVRVNAKEALKRLSGAAGEKNA